MKKKLKTFIMKILPSWLLRYKDASHGNVLYLTFDDGPDPEVTPKVLALLQQYNAQASFFVVGEKAMKFPNIIKSIHNSGHLVANHSYHHVKFSDLKFTTQLQEVELTNQTIKDIIETDCRIFRPPGGIWSIRLLWSLFLKGIVLVNWNRDSLDCRHNSSQEIKQLFKKHPVQSGDIILFHDDSEKVCDILCEMLPYWQAKGFSFSVLSSAS